MADDSSKQNFFSRLDARARVFVLLGTVVGVIMLIYFGVRYFSSGNEAIGASQVAGAPRDLRSIPGGQLTAEYSKALQQANAQSAKQAQMTGESAVPTLMNFGQNNAAASNAGGCVICSDQSADVKYSLDQWVRQGKISPEVSAQLQQMANKNVPVSEFSAYLDNLVKEGKITPEQSRQLLEEYKKQHANALADESAPLMDSLIKSGKLSTDAANTLLDLQKKNVTPNAYAAKLQEMVQQGKITPDVAQQLLSQYQQQQAKEALNQGIANIQQMQRDGTLTPEVANDLIDMQKRNVPLDAYQAQLQKYVAEGKMTPATAQKLLEDYQKQKTASGPAATIQDMVKKAEDTANNQIDSLANGKISKAVADDLKDMMQRKVSTEEYNDKVNQLVRDGKISADEGKQLMDHYKQVKDAQENAMSTLSDLARNGKLSAAEAQDLANQMQKGVSVDQYKDSVDKLVKAGKISAADAKKLVDNYQKLKNAEQSTNSQIDQLSTGKISKDVADALKQKIAQNVPYEDYQAYVQQMVKEGKIKPEDVQSLLDNYKKVHGLKDMASTLNNLQANNASPAQYAEELKRQVAAGVITPEEAARLMKDYQAATALARGLAAGQTAAGGPAGNQAVTPQFAALQQRLAQQGLGTNAAGGAAGAGQAPTAAQFAAAQNQAAEQATQDQQAEIDTIMTAMAAQAGDLVGNAWPVANMVHKEGTPPATKTVTESTKSTSSSSTQSGAGAGGAGSSGPPLIKAGTILFAVLDTAVNSDYPDTPVMATIVAGELKGAKLLGKMVTAKDVVGQLDRVSLTFTLMNEDAWNKSKTCNAFAIDPDTARTVLASNVNYHYLERFGAMFATSFLQGYASAITQAGTSTTGIFGTSTVHPELSPSSKFLTAMGQVGQTLGAATANYTKIPPTVKVDAGVGLGILFMADVT